MSDRGCKGLKAMADDLDRVKEQINRKLPCLADIENTETAMNWSDEVIVHHEGAEGYFRGSREDQNPYSKTGDAACHDAWQYGWRQAARHWAIETMSAMEEDRERVDPMGWKTWDGTYIKRFYDIELHDNQVVQGCWPNAGVMFATDGSGREWAPHEVKLIRLSGPPKGLADIVKPSAKP